MSVALDDLEWNTKVAAEGARLVEAAEVGGVPMRLIGGVAIFLHCSTLQEEPGFRRVGDIDAVVAPRQHKLLTEILTAKGYEPEARFNALHGDRRMIFQGPYGGLDVLVGSFEMCHRIDLSGRLSFDSPTVSATDLLLTKLQIVELNAKDQTDALLLLEDHEVARGEGDVINLDYIEMMVAGDWGLWRTIMGTLQQLRQSARGDTAAKIEMITASLESAPKSLRFKLRARVGERVRWYELPEEAR